MIKDVIANSFSVLFSRIINYLFILYLARSLSPIDFSEYSSYYNMLSYVALVTLAGLNVYLTKECSSGENENNSVRTFLQVALLLLIIYLMLTLFIFGARYFSVIDHKWPRGTSDLLFLLTALSLSVISLIQSYLFSIQEVAAATRYQVVSGFMLALGQSVSFVILGVQALYLSLLISCMAAVGYGIYLKKTTWHISLDFSILKSLFSVFKKVTFYAINSYLVLPVSIYCVYYAQNNIEIATEQASYQIALQWQNIFNIITASITAVLLPNLIKANIDSSKKKGVLMQKYRVGFNSILIFSISVALLIYASSDYIIGMYKIEYRKFGIYIFMSCVTFCFSLLSMYLGNWLIAIGKLKAATLANVFWACLFFICMAFFQENKFSVVKSLYFSQYLSFIVSITFMMRVISNHWEEK